MSNDKLKELIYGLGDILKVDKKFIKNNSNNMKPSIAKSINKKNAKSINKKNLKNYNQYEFLLNVYNSLDELNKLAESINLKQPIINSDNV